MNILTTDNAVDARRERNSNFILWKKVSYKKRTPYTECGPVRWKHTQIEIGASADDEISECRPEAHAYKPGPDPSTEDYLKLMKSAGLLDFWTHEDENIYSSEDGEMA